MAAVQEGVRGGFGGNGLERPFYGCDARQGFCVGLLRLWNCERVN